MEWFDTGPKQELNAAPTGRGGGLWAFSDLLEVKVGERLQGGEGSGENAHAIGAQIVAPEARNWTPLSWLIASSTSRWYRSKWALRSLTSDYAALALHAGCSWSLTEEATLPKERRVQPLAPHMWQELKRDYAQTSIL